MLHLKHSNDLHERGFLSLVGVMGRKEAALKQEMLVKLK